ncbi:hypothetical protein ACEPAI_6075 [Sanghuangporus weigelae]
MAAPPPAHSPHLSPHPINNTNTRRQHRKRVSLSRLSSDTTTTLPSYRSSIAGLLDPTDRPPDYPDSAEEADEETETDDQITQLISPPVSPRLRRRKLISNSNRLGSGSGTGFGFQPRTCVGSLYAHPSSQSDIFLDKILERSVAALELSNTLLQSSMSTQSSLNHVLSPPSPEESLDSQARLLTDRIRANNHARWMDDLDVLANDVEALFDDKNCSVINGVDIPGRAKGPNKAPDEMVSRSLPASSSIRKPQRNGLGLRGHSDNGRLRLTTDQHAFSSYAPRAITQYVNADAELGGLHGSSFDMSQSILLPSTTGLRSSSTLTSFGPPVSPAFSPPPPSTSSPSPAYASLARQASRSPRPSRSPSASGSSCRTYRQRSSSRSSSNRAPSPHLLPRIIPPPIQELPSQSDSSGSDSPHPLRTVESLRKILDEQPMQPTSPDGVKRKQSESRLAPHPAPAFLPRSPPVSPVLSTSTTTTSISRIYTKGSHSTSTRPRSPPPRHSSLKHRPPPLDADPSSLTTSITSLRSPLPAHSSATSSGRSTPRSVAFGPLPEPIRPDGAPSRFKEQREAKAKAKKARSRSSSRANGKDGRGEGGRGGHENDKEESSWWTTWLIGGSSLSMSASRAEERAEDRMARSWGRPGTFDDWAV